MHPLISKLLHWFLYGGTLFFAAGAVAEPAAPAAAAPAAPASSPDPAPAAAPAAEPAAPATPAAPSLTEIVNKAAADAEKSLTKTRRQQPAAPVQRNPQLQIQRSQQPSETCRAKYSPRPLNRTRSTNSVLYPPRRSPPHSPTLRPQSRSSLKEKGLSVETLSANARLAAQTSQFLERVPSLEALDVALEGNANFQKLESGLPAVQSVQDFDKFMTETLVPMSFILDEKGQPIPDPDNPGAFKNDGSIGKLIDFSADVRDAKLGELADMMIAGAGTNEQAKSYASDLKAAVEFVGQFIKNGYRMPGAPDGKTDTKNLPKDVQERLANAEKIERESKERDAKSTQAALDQKEDRIISQTDKYVAPIIKDFLDKTALCGELKALIADTVWSKLIDQMTKTRYISNSATICLPMLPITSSGEWPSTNNTWRKESSRFLKPSSGRSADPL